MKKRDVFKYSLVISVFVVLIFFLVVLRIANRNILTGFAVFEDAGTNFDLGIYQNVSYNGSGVVLVGRNLTGSYTSKIFDAGAESIWNNLSWKGNEPSVELLFAVDSSGAVYSSSDFGISWNLRTSDYGRGTSTQGMASDSNYLYIIVGGAREVWMSENGESWVIINSSFADGDLKEIEKDNIGNLYVAQGDGFVFLSNDSGVSWIKKADFDVSQTNDAKGFTFMNNVLYIADGANDVYNSSNQAQSWTEITADYGGGVPDDIANNGSALFIIQDKKVWVSNNKGSSWNNLVNNFGGDKALRAEKDSLRNLYILDQDGEVYKSVNGGLNWNLIGDINPGNNNPKGFTNFIKNTSLNFQVRNCSQSNCNDGIWREVNLNNFNLKGRYFQYKVIFKSPDNSVSPFLKNVSVDYSIINTAPVLSIIHPQNGASYGFNKSLNLNFSVSDAEGNLDKCWYNLNSGINISLVGCQNISFDVSGNGNYVLTVYANDSKGLESNKSSAFNVQIGAPTIVLHFPIDVYLNKKGIQFNYTPVDIDLKSCELWIDSNGSFSLNQTDNYVISGVVNYFNLNLNDGEYLWNIKCTDNIGNFAFNGNKTFYIDSIVPNLIIFEPSGNKTSRIGIPLQFNVSDASPVSCRYNIYRGVSLEILNTPVNCNESNSFDVSVDADFVLNFYSNDSAGNSNFTNSIFSVSTNSGSSSSGSSSGGGSSGGGSSGGGSSSSSGGGILPRLETFEFETSNIGDIVAKAGDEKTLSLNVKNTGKNFLNNCKLIAEGDFNSWFYSDQIEGIAPGQSINFIFNLNIVEEALAGDYFGTLEIKCDELNESQELKISIAGKAAVNIKSIVNEKKGLRIKYNFDKSGISDDEISIDIWIADSEGLEIKKIQDIFSINEEITERNILIELPEGLTGIYYVYFALSSDLENSVKQSVVLGKSVSTGTAVFADEGKKISYIVFILIIAAGVFFIIRNYFKENKSKNKKK